MFTAAEKKTKGTAFLIIGVCLICGGMLIYYGTAVKEGVIKGLQLSAGVLIPSLFPFMVLSSFFIGSNAYFSLRKPLGFFPRLLFHLPSYTAGIILLSMVGGYPVGAKMIRMLLEQDKLTLKQAQTMLCFCFGSGPAFSIVIVGIGVFSSIQAGMLLFISHILASMITGMFFAPRTPPIEYTVTEHLRPVPLSSVFVDAVNSSTSAMLSISAFMCLFCGMLSVMEKTSFLSLFDNLFPYWEGEILFSDLLPGVFEVTGGCLRLSCEKGAAFPLAAFYLSFGGFCVHAQVFGLLKGYRFSYPKFLLSRVCCAVLSALIASIMLLLFPLSLSVSHPLGQPMVSVFSVSPLSALFFLFLVCSFVFQTGAKRGREKTFL